MAPFKKFASLVATMAVVVLVHVSLATETAWAQAGALGSIMGKAADETGGVLPGATVTATSPALQVRNVTTVTDAEGNYRLRDLPAPGMYRVVFELTGFQTVAFEGVSLNAASILAVVRNKNTAHKMINADNYQKSIRTIKRDIIREYKLPF